MSNGTGALEEELMRTGEIVFSNRGRSMMPLIREGKDLVVIKKCRGRLKKYDVPLYKRDSGQYVLHRIIKVRKNDYVICGDNRYHKEYGITDRHIIGVLTAVIRNGKEISVTNRRYRLYVHVWYFLFPVRAFIMRARNVIRRIEKKR